jgi:hypothetical protein
MGITVDLGSITVPSAAVADVVAWLDTQALTAVEQVEKVDPEDGHLYNVPRIVVVPETPKEKLARVMRAAGVNQVRSAIKQLRDARAAAEAQAVSDALPDPVAEEVE